MFEMTASFVLKPEAPGIPEAIKLQEQHRALFPAGAVIDEASGQSLAAWAKGSKQEPTPHTAAMDALKAIVEEGKEAAAGGRDAFKAWWNRDDIKGNRLALNPFVHEFEAIVKGER